MNSATTAPYWPPLPGPKGADIGSVDRDGPPPRDLRGGRSPGDHGRSGRGRPRAAARSRLAGTAGLEERRRIRPGTVAASLLLVLGAWAAWPSTIHRGDGGTVLVSVVEDQVASAGRVRRALSPHAHVPDGAVPGATTAALATHEGPAAADQRIRGWNRLLVDHPAGVTVEVSSDVLGAEVLLAVAGDLDLDRLARTVAPRR